LDGFGAWIPRRALRESLVIRILFEEIDFANINASLIAWVSAVKMLQASAGNYYYYYYYYYITFTH